MRQMVTAITFRVVGTVSNFLQSIGLLDAVGGGELQIMDEIVPSLPFAVFFMRLARRS